MKPLAAPDCLDRLSFVLNWPHDSKVADAETAMGQGNSNSLVAATMLRKFTYRTGAASFSTIGRLNGNMAAGRPAASPQRQNKDERVTPKIGPTVESMHIGERLQPLKAGQGKP
jgi:hypothetical protein